MSFSHDVTSQNFDQLVIEKSFETPVLVDFWAEWCAPCRMLKPTLEKLAEDYQGGFILAKVNTEDNPSLAQKFQIRGIPDVRLFKDGKVVDSFSGVQGEAAIRALLDAYVSSPVDEFITAAKSNKDVLAALLKGYAVHKENSKFLLSLAQEQLRQNQLHEAINTSRLIPAHDDLYQDAKDVEVLADFLSSTQSLEKGTQASAHFKEAAAAYERGQIDAAMDSILDHMKQEGGQTAPQARNAMLALLRQCSDPVKTRKYRQQFAAIINS
ncbi:MAG: thioredoxin [Pseudobdellovibrionaceae bacterium]|nr:thioredoxin [Bdellovibrionales bacterium]USN48569.1 MAG: thioredoxin [Pseudobdellovibrionaceae bacterium]